VGRENLKIELRGLIKKVSKKVKDTKYE